MVTAYAPLWTISARLPLPVHVFSSARCQLVSAASGRGSQAREAPSGRAISTRVVTSNVRHPGAAARTRRHGSAATAAALSNWRRFIGRKLMDDGPAPQLLARRCLVPY